MLVSRLRYHLHFEPRFLQFDGGPPNCTGCLCSNFVRGLPLHRLAGHPVPCTTQNTLCCWYSVLGREFLYKTSLVCLSLTNVRLSGQMEPKRQLAEAPDSPVTSGTPQNIKTSFPDKPLKALKAINDVDEGQQAQHILNAFCGRSEDLTPVDCGDVSLLWPQSCDIFVVSISNRIYSNFHYMYEMPLKVQALG